MVKKKKILWIILGVIAAAVVSSIIVVKRAGLIDSDYFFYWLAGKFVTTGQYVYDYEAWEAAHIQYGSAWLGTPFHYPLYLAYMMIPLSALNLYVSATIWLTAIIVFIAWAIWVMYLRAQKGLAPLYVFVIFIGCALFRAVILNVYIGQLDGLLFGFVVLSAVCFQKGHYGWAGFILAMLQIKPNIGLPIAGVILLYCLLQRYWRTIISFSITMIVFMGSTLLLRPKWITDFLANDVGRSDFILSYTPTWWGQASNFCGWTKPCVYYLGVFGCLVIAGLGLWYMIRNYRKMDIWAVISIAVFITLQIIPYMWAYNQIYLLIPIAMITRHIMKTRTILIGSIVPILMSLISVLFIFLGLQSGHDNMSYWLTVIVAFVWCAIFIKKINADNLIVNQPDSN